MKRVPCATRNVSYWNVFHSFIIRFCAEQRRKCTGCFKGNKTFSKLRSFRSLTSEFIPVPTFRILFCFFFPQSALKCKSRHIKGTFLCRILYCLFFKSRELLACVCLSVGTKVVAVNLYVFLEHIRTFSMVMRLSFLYTANSGRNAYFLASGTVRRRTRKSV